VIIVGDWSECVNKNKVSQKCEFNDPNCELMAKRKKEEADTRDELPKRIRNYLSTRSSSKSASHSVPNEIVDEILSSPALVNKVRKILKSQANLPKVSPSTSR